MVALSIVTAVDKMVEALPRFLSPYLRPLLLHESSLAAKWRALGDPTHALGDTARAVPVINRLKATRHRLAATVPPRVLIPAVGQCYHDMLARGDFAAIGPLLGKSRQW